MTQTVEKINGRQYRAYANASGLLFRRNLCCRPFWLEAWWEHFGGNYTPWLLALKNGGELLGLAPFMISGNTASFMGAIDVCDYQDISTHNSYAETMCNGLLAYAEAEGITSLNLGHVRPESFVLTVLADVAIGKGLNVQVTEEAASMEMQLPQSWEGYLKALTAKQKHEIERKLRRLAAVGQADYSWHTSPEGLPEMLDNFIRLFRDCDGEKGGFMTEEMAAYFRTLSSWAADDGYLCIGILKYPGDILGMTLGFVDGSACYLYNSAYNPQYKYCSVGLLSKIYGIKECITNHIEIWDFLKGEEAYKHQLGGRTVPLYRCVINI
ncbi:GNAT family N-acetyltransferase [Chloroflexota bacterium]